MFRANWTCLSRAGRSPRLHLIISRQKIKMVRKKRKDQTVLKRKIKGVEREKTVYPRIGTVRNDKGKAMGGPSNQISQ